ncbi:MAG: pyridoxal-phosphate dependent enzyme [Calditrichia bacterium]
MMKPKERTTVMKTIDSVFEAIGKTPLVKLEKIGKEFPSHIFAKLEYLNPAGSVKDRMALYMILDAEHRGLLKPGGTIVENSSGNTGAALAMIAAVKGYRCIITMPDKMSSDRGYPYRCPGKFSGKLLQRRPADSFGNTRGLLSGSV